jgi:hypothetical protein
LTIAALSSGDYSNGSSPEKSTQSSSGAKPRTIKPHKLKTTNGKYLPSGGRVVVSLLAERSLSFEHRINSDEFLASHRPISKVIHPTLPYALISHGGGNTSHMVLRVLMAPRGGVQIIRRIVWLYKVLIAWIYELLETHMNSSNLPISTHRRQHQRLLRWLEDQIFAPADNHLPVIGCVQTPDPAWKEFYFDWEKVGHIQAELIKYFSQSDLQQEVIEFARDTACRLIKQFQSENESKYLLIPFQSAKKGTFLMV